jgi:hypothetical protein
METTMNFLRNLFRSPSPEMLAARELDQARRSLLEAHSAAEYADSVIAYNQARIERLSAFLAQEREA